MLAGGSLRWLAVVVALASVTACGTTRTVEHANAFAGAGVAFADAVPPVVDEAFKLSATADSLVLTQARPDLDASLRSQTLQRNDELLEQRLQVLRDLKRHALLLRSYFTALQIITETDAASVIAVETQNLVSRLAQLRPEITAASIAGRPIGEFIQPAVALAVGAYQNAVLRRELEAHGEAIEREIALQRAALAALHEQMVADQELQLQGDRNLLFFQYVDAGSLPSDWADRRIAALRRVVEIGSYDAAVTAASSLHQSWIAFVENRLEPARLRLLLRDVEGLLRLVATLQPSG
jgi:hypothetical protein